MRVRMSRPLTGSTPSGWSQLMPPNVPFGASVSGLIRSWWNSFGWIQPKHPVRRAAR